MQLRMPGHAWFGVSSCELTSTVVYPLAALTTREHKASVTRPLLQVADALDDAEMDKWIGVAAARLTQHVASHDQQHDDFTPQQVV